MEKDIATGMTKVRHPQYRGYDELLDDAGNKVYRDQKTKEFVECVTIDVPAGGKYFTERQLGAQAAYRERGKESESRELRRINHGPLGKFYLSACRTDQFEGLNPQDITRLIFLASHLNYKSVLMLNERRKMTLNDLSEVLGVSDSTARRLWANVGNRYIVQMDDGSLIVKDTFFRGKQKHITERLTKFYIQAVQKLYKATPPNKHSCLGRVFQLLAYVNVEFNILCHNPEETDLSKVEPMTFKQFCEETGYNWSKAHRLAKDLSGITFEVAGEQRHFVAFVSTNVTSTDRQIVINPRVLYGGHNFERVETFALFFKEGECSTNLK